MPVFRRKFNRRGNLSSSWNWMSAVFKTCRRWTVAKQRYALWYCNSIKRRCCRLATGASVCEQQRERVEVVEHAELTDTRAASKGLESDRLNGKLRTESKATGPCIEEKKFPLLHFVSFFSSDITLTAPPPPPECRVTWSRGALRLMASLYNTILDSYHATPCQNSIRRHKLTRTGVRYTH